MAHQFNNRITLERLREVLDYDPATGVFIWKKQYHTDRIGKRAGSVGKMQGYTVIRIDEHLYRASRLAWFYCTGKWPTYLIDHIDGRRDNDSFANLREASSQENNANKSYVSSACGFKGVYRKKGNRYIARLVLNRRGIYLGTFSSPLEAAVAYNHGAIKHFGEFAKINKV